jgi:hypothetical protein
MWVDRALLERIRAALLAQQTSAGHLAQRVTHEHLGYCGHRSESPLCTAHRALVDDLTAALDRPRMRRPRAS